MIEKGNRLKDILCNLASIMMVICGLFMFYSFKIHLVLRWLIVVVSIIVATVMFFFVSSTGINTRGHIRSAWREVRKVVWPSRKETIQFSWIIVIFVAVLGLVLWMLDSALSWILYGVLLKGSV
jgi:preprotein translocase subunit SecE